MYLEFIFTFCLGAHGLALKISARPDPDCKFVGQFKPNPENECEYFRCDYGSEPWRDGHGNVALYTVPLPCPLGTSVNIHKFDPEKPCGEYSTKCSSGCHRIGEFIPSDDPCSYKVCSYGNEPWTDAPGLTPLIAQEHRCPNSLGTNRENFNKNNPCDTPNVACKYVPKPLDKYQPPVGANAGRQFPVNQQERRKYPRGRSEGNYREEAY